MIGVVPLEPAVDRAAGDTALGRDVDHPSSVDVRAYCTTAAPLAEVVLELGLDDEFIELLELRRATARASNRVSCLCFRHDRETMILSRSAVKPGSQAARSCLGLANGALFQAT